jgi:hypothetical protein
MTNEPTSSEAAATNVEIAPATAAPATTTAPVPAPSPTGYTIPIKRILSKVHLAAFARSPAHDDILGFIDTLNESIVGKKLSEKGEPSEVSFEFLLLCVFGGDRCDVGTAVSSTCAITRGCAWLCIE